MAGEPLISAFRGEATGLVSKQDDDLAPHVEAGVIVVAEFVGGGAVAGEDEPAGNFTRRGKAKGNEVVVQFQRAMFAADLFGQAVVRGEPRAGGHGEGLEEPLRSGGIEAEALVALLEECAARVDAFGAGAAAFHIGSGESLDGVEIACGVCFGERRSLRGRDRDKSEGDSERHRGEGKATQTLRSGFRWRGVRCLFTL